MRIVLMTLLSRFFISLSCIVIIDSPPGAHLFRLLRPELVQAHTTPLCSDAYSRILQPSEAEIINGEVLEATKSLYCEVYCVICATCMRS